MTVAELVEALRALPQHLPVAYPTESGYVFVELAREGIVYVDDANGHVEVVALD